MCECMQRGFQPEREASSVRRGVVEFRAPVLACAQVEWLQPYTDAKIRALGAAGVRSLLAVPISFVSEHIETLEEIDMEYRELALESGIQVCAPASCTLCYDQANVEAKCSVWQLHTPNFGRTVLPCPPGLLVDSVSCTCVACISHPLCNLPTLWTANPHPGAHASGSTAACTLKERRAFVWRVASALLRQVVTIGYG